MKNQKLFNCSVQSSFYAAIAWLLLFDSLTIDVFFILACQLEIGIYVRKYHLLIKWWTSYINISYRDEIWALFLCIWTPLICPYINIFCCEMFPHQKSKPLSSKSNIFFALKLFCLCGKHIFETDSIAQQNWRLHSKVCVSSGNGLTYTDCLFVSDKSLSHFVLLEIILWLYLQSFFD